MRTEGKIGTREEPARDAWVSVARLGRARGLKGDVYVHLYNPVSELLSNLREVRVGKNPQTAAAYAVSAFGRVSNRGVLSLEGVGTRDAAEGLTGLEIFVRRGELPEPADDEYYCVDLIGLRVETPDGKVLGRLREILPTASNDIYRVEGPEGELLLPAVKDVIVSVDLPGGRVVVRPPEVVDAF